ncbi:DUF4124 domain-containing protein [Massilia sp. CF038]|uniref:DUF4124 domain-containing protein n=1 Tax=Massilia sp. CF038 TaxID=1881045 RepID=UPI00090F87AC|nr:DUF4124 domain-containing protein [Massilia sp. CF038]SHG70521.1 protein of unknown function [Massilia sp. CF038]
MNKITWMRGVHFLAGSALLIFTSVAHAQYVWVDEKGVKQFSDRSPPANIPAKNILKSPRGVQQAEQVQAVAAPAAAPGNSLADREADYKKRQLAKADADKKASEDAAIASAKKGNCDAARVNKAALESGQRMRTGADGAMMDDQQRAAEIARANKALADCAK